MPITANKTNWFFGVATVTVLLLGAVSVGVRVSAPSNLNDKDQYQKLANAIELIQQQVNSLTVDSITDHSSSPVNNLRLTEQLVQDVINLKTNQKDLLEAIENLNQLLSDSNQNIVETTPTPTSEDFETEYQDAVQRVTEQKYYLDSALSQESFDENWNQTVENQIETLFDEKQIQSVDVHDLRCGETFCAMSFASNSSDELTMLGYEVDIGGSEGWVYRQQDEELGKEVLVMYLAREGYSLPRDVASNNY